MAKSKNKNISKTKLKIQKAYKNIDFLNSPAARNIRILTEMVEPETRFRRHRVRDTVVFFGSARTLPGETARENLATLEKKRNGSGKNSKGLKLKIESAQRDLIMSRYYDDAALLAEKLTLWFKELESSGKRFKICTGGGPGIMEAANRGAQRAGGDSVGLNISLPFEQEPNIYQTPDLALEFHYFFIRKFWFFYLAKALLVFPGGFGTMDEFFELLTLIQTAKTKKPMPVVLYGSEYWNKVINIDEMVRWGTISPVDLKLFHTCDDVDEALEYLKKEISRYYLPRKKKQRANP